MNDDQFGDFMGKVDRFFALREEKFLTRDEFREEMLKIHSKMDWIIGALDTDEKERLALGFNFDRRYVDHERRIVELEKSLVA